MSKIPQQVLGQSPAWLATLDRISGLAALNRPVLLLGERGTGKALAAARLHFLSERWEGPYQRLNVCEYDSDEILETLFGDGGFGREAGLMDALSGGTLFLDSIDQLSARVQARLMSVLEATGGKQSESEDAEADVRLLAATDQDLNALVSQGRFLANLRDMLAFEVLSLPPLRARKGDVALLARHFGLKMARELGFEGFAGFSPEALRALDHYDWPGNIRELKIVVERSVARAWNDEIDLTRLPVTEIAFDVFDSPWPLAGLTQTLATTTGGVQKAALPPQTDTPKQTGFSERIRAFELGLIEEAMKASKNHQGKAAKYLGLSYHQFRGLLRKHGLKR